MQTNYATDRPNPNQAGFTLVEVLIAILVSMVIMAGVTTVFLAHSRQYSQQDDVAVMQQTLRGTLLIMPNEFRLAGCDPLKKGDAGIEEATATTFEFTADIGGKPSHFNDADGKIGDCATCDSGKGCCAGEQVRYWFRKHHRTCRDDEEQDLNYPAGVLCRKVMDKKGRWDDRYAEINPLADNIENLEFSYVLENDRIICPSSTNPGGEVSRLQRAKVRAVQIALLARAEHASPKEGHRHAGLFKTACGTEWKSQDLSTGDANYVPQDGHRRKLMLTTVQLRNMPMPHRGTSGNEADKPSN